MKLLSAEQLEDVLEKETYAEAREAYVTRMSKAGYSIFYPDDNELTIDIDSEEQFERFKLSWDRFKREVEDVWDQTPSYNIRPSRSYGEHRHIVVKLPFKVTTEERIAWQFVLCSDPVRETLSMFRVLRGDVTPTLLAMLP